MIQVRIREKTYDADYAGVGYLGFLKMQLKDERLLSEIVPEVEGAEEIIRIADGRERVYTGFTQLIRVERIDEGSVVLLLGKCSSA